MKNFNLKSAAQKGFTLIELVVVIIILGILAATAMPKFTDLSDEAAQAAVQGVAGSLESGSQINYGVRKTNSAKGVAVTNCTDGASVIEGLPAGYTITAAAAGADVATSCTVTGKNSKTATFKIMGIN